MTLGLFHVQEGVKQRTALVSATFNSLALSIVLLMLLLSLTRQIKNIPHLH